MGFVILSMWLDWLLFLWQLLPTFHSFVVYVESSDCCNQLAFKLGSGVGAQSGTSLATRSWQIKVTQFSCNSNNLAPEGCVQYFFGQNGQTVN